MKRVAVKRISDDDGASALAAVRAGAAGRPQIATAVRWLLQVLADAVPGNSVEVRVPPFAAVQAVPGPRHTRGTPPNVIEMDAVTWIALATGEERWEAAVARHAVQASGARADLAEFLPLRLPI